MGRAPPGRSGSGPALALASLLVALGVVAALRIVPYQADDAHITYRFALRAAAGEGLRYNLGGPRVEGYSSPAWLALLVLGARARLSLPAVATALGLLSHLALLLGLLRARALWAAALWALAPTAVLYSVTGLEEPLFLLVVVLAAWGACERSVPVYALLAVGLAPWVRPEGPWLTAVLVAQRALLLRKGVLRDPSTARALAAGAAGTLVLLVARLGYFGAWLPNTAYAKAPELRAGLVWLLHALALPWVQLTVCAAFMVLRWGSARGRSWALASALWTLAAVLEGGDWMPQARLLAPALVLLVLAATSALERAERPLRLARAALVAGACVCALGETHAQLGRARASQATLVQENRGLYARLATRGARSVALVDIGVLGTTLPSVAVCDLGALTDPVLARAPGGLLSKRFELSYVWERCAPDAVLLRIDRVPAQGARIEPAWALSEVEARMLAAPTLAQRYALAEVVGPSAPRSNAYVRLLYLRR